jgi:hypothetical protein
MSWATDSKTTADAGTEADKAPMKHYFYQQPSYPVVKNEPTLDNCIKTMTLWREGLQVAGITAATWGYGYVLGRPVRFATANTASVLGFSFAAMWVTQNARFRLKGFEPNSREQGIFGIESPAVVAPGATPALERFPTANLPENDINWLDYHK